MYKKIIIGIILLLVTLTSSVYAQVRNRWTVDFKHKKPELLVYRDPLGNKSNCWYVVFEIYNNSIVNMGEAIPIQVDLMLYTEFGKEYMADPEKVKLENIHSGKYFSSVICPEVEHKIIEKVAQIGNRPEGFIKEGIETFKKDNQYLNPQELRERKFISPGETMTGLAIFPNVDPKTRILELQVSGLIDVLKVEKMEAKEMKMVYENKTLKTRYDYPGDPYNREGDVLTFNNKKWETRLIGPVASKDTLELLINMLIEALKYEKGETKKERELSPLDLRIANSLLKIATNIDFGFDSSKSTKENENAIWKWHEWWITNNSKLYYDEKTNKFKIRIETPK